MTTPTSAVLPGAAPAAAARPGTPAATEAQGDQFARLVERHLADERPNRAASDTGRDRPEDRPARTTPADRARRADRPGSRPRALREHEAAVPPTGSAAPAHDPLAAAATAQPASGQDATAPAAAGASTTGNKTAVSAGAATGGRPADAPAATTGTAATDAPGSTPTPAATGTPTPAAAAKLAALADEAGVRVNVVAASSTPATDVTAPTGGTTAALTGPGQQAPAAAATRHGARTDGATDAPSSGTTSPATAVAGGAQAHPGSQGGPGHDAERGRVPDAAATPGTTGNAAVTGAAAATTASSGPQTTTGSPVLDQVLPAVPALAAKGQGVHSLTLRLHPADLGEVHLTVTVRGDKVDVTIAAGDRARDVLREGSSQLRSLLDLAGHTAGSFTVRDLPGTGAVTAGSAGHGAGQGGQGTQHDAGSGQPQGFVAGQGSQPGQHGAQERGGRPGGDVPVNPAASTRPDGHGRTTQPVRPRAAGTSALDVTI